MPRLFLAFVFGLCLAVSALAQKPAIEHPGSKAPSIVGTWKVNPKIKDPNFADPTAWFKFKADGTMAYNSKAAQGQGTYTMKGYHGRLTITHRNGGRPRVRSLAEAGLELTADGKTLMIEGAAGSTMALRLVRKK